MNGHNNKGHPTGLAALYALYRDELLRFLTARTGSRSEAEDVLQEVWLKIDGAPAGPITNGRAYMYRIAQNLVLDRRRQAERRWGRERDWADVVLDQRADGPEPVADDDAHSAMIEQQDADRLAAAIATLPPGAARAFRLHKLDGLSHAETAAQLGISRKGVEKHMSVAMVHLRRALDRGNWGDVGPASS